MRKLFVSAILLSAVLGLATVVACGGGDKPAPKTPEPAGTSTGAEEPAGGEGTSTGSEGAGSDTGGGEKAGGESAGGSDTPPPSEGSSAGGAADAGAAKAATGAKKKK